jgi:hypothetical protein
MTDHALSETLSQPSAEYHIMHGQAGFFTVDFISTYNALHRITGFKTEDAARAWIAETRRLTDKYP